MHLMSWRSRPLNPFSSLFGLQQEINRMFEEFSGGNGSREAGENPIVPALDIKEDDQYLTVTADLPGVEQKDVEIALHDNVLILKGEKRSERHEKKDSYRCVERMFGSFERRVTLPADVDSDKAEATMNNGVLTLRLPKLAGSRSKTIPIRSGTGSQSLPMSESDPSTSDPSTSAEQGPPGSQTQTRSTGTW
jgi:HSP20 family protein